MSRDTIEKLVGQFEGHRTKFETFCRSLSEEQLERLVPDSEWRVKDFVSHLATLDTLLTRQFESLAAGSNETLGQNDDGAPFNIDSWNNAEIDTRRDWSLEQILDEARANRRPFLDALSRLTDEQIEQTMHFTGDNKRPPADVQFKLFLSGVARHDPIHVADMIKALPERAEQPEIKAWLEDPVVRWYQTAMSGPATR